MLLHDEIKLKARKALDDLITKGVDSGLALKEVQDQFVDDVVSVMAAGINALKIGLITPAKLKRMAVGKVALSDVLYKHSEDVSANVSRVIKEHAQGAHNAQELARKIYEGYSFQDDPLKIKKSLPKYLLDPLSKLDSKTLKTPALRAAYNQVFKAATEKQLNSALKTAMYERNRYFANRIAQTELHRINTANKVKKILDNDAISVVQIRMSRTHPDVDICDYHAGLNAYGLGKGFYPKHKAPMPPFHPHCRCIVAPIVNLSAEGVVFDKDADRKFMHLLSDDNQTRVLGSSGRLAEFKRSGSVVSASDLGKNPLYLTKRTGTILDKALLPDKNGGELVVLGANNPDTINNMEVKIITREIGIAHSINRPGWIDAKYDTTIHGDVDEVKTHNHYELAKSGDFEESILLAAAFLNIDEIAERYDNPIILPIMAEEKQGKNAIPLGMSFAIQAQTGWAASDSIFQSNRAGHTGANGWYRLVSHATFEGNVIVGGRYLILDDFIGMGGTLASLKAFIENSGGKVVGHEILTGKPESHILYLRNKTLKDLRIKHGQFEEEFKEMLGFGYEGLTESEAKYLLRAKSIERLRNQLTKAISQREGSGDE